MTDAIANPRLDHMRKFAPVWNDMQADMQDLRVDFRDLCKRVAHVEKQLNILNRRMIRFNAPLSRIDKRLDLVEG